MANLAILLAGVSFSLALVAPCAASVAGATLNGSIVPHEPLRLEGTIQSAALAGVTASGVLAGALFNSTRVDIDVLVEQWKWQDSVGEDAAQPSTASLYTVETRFFQKARLAFSNPTPMNNVEVASSGTARRAELLAATCAIQRTSPSADPSLIADFGELSLTADCNADHLTIELGGENTLVLSLAGGNLEIDGSPRSGSQDGPTVIQTGSRTAPSKLATNLYEHIFRRATLTIRDERFSSVLSIRGAEIRFDAPTIVGFGALHIPPHEGRLSFSGIPVSDQQGAINATGQFVLAAADDGPRSVWITGSYSRLEIARPAAPMILFGSPDTPIAVAAFLGFASLVLFVVARARKKAGEDHPTRAAIVSLVEATPGIRLHELVSRLGSPRGSVMHHLTVLRSKKRIVVVQAPRSLRLFPPSRSGAPETDPRIDALRTLLQQMPNAKQSEIAAALGVSQSFVSKQVRRLERNGALSRRRIAAGTSYQVHPFAPDRWREPIGPPHALRPSNQIPTS